MSIEHRTCKNGDVNDCINSLDIGSNQAKHSSPDLKVIKIRSFVKKYSTISTFANKPAANTLKNKQQTNLPYSSVTGQWTQLA